MSRHRISYQAKFKAIQPFVKFKFKHPNQLGMKNKAKITKYYNFIQGVGTAYRPVKIKKGNFKRIQKDLNPEFTKIRGKVAKTEFKVLFIPTKFHKDTQIKLNKKLGKYVLETPATDETERREAAPATQFSSEIFPEKEALQFTESPVEYLASKLKKYPQNARFQIVYPHGALGGFETKESLIQVVESMDAKYTGAGVSMNHQFGQWFFGLNIRMEA